MPEPVTHMVGHRNGVHQGSARCYATPHPIPDGERHTRRWDAVTCPVCRLLRPHPPLPYAERLQAQTIGRAILHGTTDGVTIDLDPEHSPIMEPGRQVRVLLLSPALDPEAPDAHP